MERIVIATDGSPASPPAVREGLDLARLLGAPVTLVVVREPARAPGAPYLHRPLSADLVSAREALREALLEADRLGVDADYEIAEGEPVEEILRTARYRDAELLVVGTRGRPGARLGSVAASLVERSPLPVLVVRAGEHVDTAAASSLSGSAP